MWISKIRLKNFRSFGPEPTTVDLQSDLTGIIGLNSAGKTALLDAFRKVFGTSSAERVLLRSDFHIPKAASSDDLEEISMFIEFFVHFESNVDGCAPELWESMIVDEPEGDPFCRIRLDGIWTRNALSIEGDINSTLSTVRVGEEDVEDEEKVLMPTRKRSLIQTLYVPALRRPSEQMRYASGSLLHRLFKHVTWSPDFEVQFKEKLAETDNLLKSENDFGNIQTKLQAAWKSFHNDERYKDSNLSVGGTELDTVLKKLEVNFSPGDVDRPYSIDELGDGYRSLFYLTLVTTLLSLEAELDLEAGAKPCLTIVLVEEPENHIAPQLLGRVLRNLKNLGALPNVQVILSSHTPSIISRIDPEAIRHLRLDKTQYITKANSLVLPEKKDEAFTYIKEAVRNYPEIYFAQLVVIGEGDSEDVVFKRLMRAYNKDFDDNLISFAPLGNRFVNHIWRLLDDIEIPYVTLLDLDKERNGGGWGRIKYVLQQLIALGFSRRQLLTLADKSILPQKELLMIHKWDESLIDIQYSWIKFLETYNVFFSKPLDLDFELLNAFTAEYQSTIPKNGGPDIPDKEKQPKEFGEKVLKGIQATLKSEKATAVTYSKEEKELMTWYNYHFLGRGKPSTHMQALSGIEDSELKKRLPKTLISFFKRISELLNDNESEE